MSNLSYEMIEGIQAGGAYNGAHLGTAGGGAGGEKSTLIPGDKPTRKAWMAAVGGMLLAGAFVGAFISSPRSSRTPINPDAASSSAAASAPMQVSKNDDAVPSCSLFSCTNSGCNWDSAPFLCLDGGSTGGCADKASTWTSENGGCFSFCDLKDCSGILERAGNGAEGAEDLPRSCGPCDDDQCSTLAKQWSQACGKAAPFVCLSGAATWGCADDALAWASAPETTCGECCDVGGC